VALASELSRRIRGEGFRSWPHRDHNLTTVTDNSSELR
jgi:hypothetical protein